MSLTLRKTSALVQSGGFTLWGFGMFLLSRFRLHRCGLYIHTPRTEHIKAIEDYAAEPCYKPDFSQSNQGVENSVLDTMRCTDCPCADFKLIANVYKGSESTCTHRVNILFHTIGKLF